jgi:hypothetical protein
MKTDLYTKTILTIIALCLAIIALDRSGIITEAKAELPYSSYGMIPVNPDGSINVKMSSTDVVTVKVEEVDAFAFFHCTVPVKIQP